MSDEIIKVLDIIADKFGLAVDWTSSNVIPYIEQLCGKYVNYEIATSIIWLLFGIGCLILGKYLFKKIKICYEKCDDMDSDDLYSWGCIGAGIGFGVAIIVGLIVIMCQAFDIITCFTFPEKIIINELKSIYTNMK